VRRGVLRLLLKLAIDLPFVGLFDFPLRGVLRLPAVSAFFEVFLKDDGKDRRAAVIMGKCEAAA
jgi:hypothetical protein